MTREITPEERYCLDSRLKGNSSFGLRCATCGMRNDMPGFAVIHHIRGTMLARRKAVTAAARAINGKEAQK